ncbi:hypothetical protein [Streptomyces sp. NPDC059894]|uniref:hypothetical protein n=1 Tax=unclassified Streptomyces TaxID=2593676 RepID=UPI003664150F
MTARREHRSNDWEPLAHHPSPDSAMAAPLDGLAPCGELVVIAVTDQAIEVKPLQLITGRQSVSGHPAGTALEVEDSIAFSAGTGVRPMIETVPLEEADDAFARMLSGAARFHMVPVPGV